jgi:hypothetical protein
MMTKGLNMAAVHSHHVGFWVDLNPLPSDALAVYLHAAFPDDRFAGSPRSDPGLGQEFLQAYHQLSSGYKTHARYPTGKTEDAIRAKARDIEVEKSEGTIQRA